MRRLAAVVGLTIAVPLTPVAAQELRIFHIDVEQGDATLLVAPGGKTLLVDSGRNGDGDRIQAVMAEAGVTQVDAFVCTHYHADHYGGVDELAGLGVAVVQAFDRGDKDLLPASKLDETRFKEYQASVGDTAEALLPGATLDLDPNLTITCIASGRRLLGDLSPTPGSDENDNSVALLVEFGEFAYFVGGDIETHTEKAIADRDLLLDVDVYQANHHGSDTSSEESFVKDLAPSVIVISNGNRADYRHPRQSTLDFFETLTPKPAVFQTNKYFKGGNGGNVPDEFIADPETHDEDGTILITVDATAGHYSVAYRELSKTFPVKGASAGSLVIASLLPDPRGSDREKEVVTLRNDGAFAVPLAGWTLRDEDGHFVHLGIHGSLAPTETLDVVRSGSRLSLNNDGDEIRLVNDLGTTVSVVRYGPVAEDQVVPGH